MRPSREPARNNQQTYFLTFVTSGRTPFFRHERWLSLFLNTVERYSHEFALHAYVIMPDHVHLLVTPNGPLERVAQLVKGGFSFQAKRAFFWSGPIWQEGFSDRRIRDEKDMAQHLHYIKANVALLPQPLAVQLGRHSEASSLHLTPVPQRLKPLVNLNLDGGTEVPPFQSNPEISTPPMGA